jgi:regulatory protein
MENIQEDVQRALNRAYFYLKFRPRTRKEVSDYLHKKSEKFYHWPDEVIDTALVLLEERGFINDRAFIESFVVSRNVTKPKSEFALRQEMMKVGVSKELLDEYFQESPTDEEALARKALAPRWSRYSPLSPKERFEKAASFLMRRGFQFSVAKKVIEERNDSEALPE